MPDWANRRPLEWPRQDHANLIKELAYENTVLTSNDEGMSRFCTDLLTGQLSRRTQRNFRWSRYWDNCYPCIVNWQHTGSSAFSAHLRLGGLDDLVLLSRA
jgi:hypothetical protein